METKYDFNEPQNNEKQNINDTSNIVPEENTFSKEPKIDPIRDYNIDIDNGDIIDFRKCTDGPTPIIEKPVSEDKIHAEAKNSQTETKNMNYSNVSQTSVKQTVKKKNSKAKQLFAMCLCACLCSAITTFGINSYMNSNQTKTISKPSETLETIKIPTVSTASDYNNDNYTNVVNNTSNVSNFDIPTIVDATMPSVVSITNTATYTYSTWLGGTQSQQVTGAGSGVIISDSDNYIYIVTNYHVIENSDSLSVQFINGIEVPAKTVNYDSEQDIAVIKVKKQEMDQETLSSIKVITIGDSDEIKLGESVIAIGNALGYGQSVTDGIISSKTAEITTSNSNSQKDFYSSFFGEEDEKNTSVFLQTNAAINPGNSGGALINAKGQLVGINTAKYQSVDVEGMGYAIPVNSIKEFLQTSMEKAAVSENNISNGKAYMGIECWTITDEIAYTYNVSTGACIQSVEPGSPAEQAGLKEGDIITNFDGKRVISSKELIANVNLCNPNETINIIVLRKGNKTYEEKEIELTLGEKLVTS